jgi:cytoskeletal protein CcmA (bactofilin family)
MFGKSSSSQGELNGFLDAGSHIKGTLHFEDTFRIDGKVTGKVESGGHLIVGEKGEVDGEVDVKRVSVSGIVRGQLKARERVEITSLGRVYADLQTPILTVEEGALLEGRCSMEKAKRGDVAGIPGNVTPIAAAKG